MTRPVAPSLSTALSALVALALGAGCPAPAADPGAVTGTSAAAQQAPAAATSAGGEAGAATAPATDRLAAAPDACAVLQEALRGPWMVSMSPLPEDVTEAGQRIAVQDPMDNWQETARLLISLGPAGAALAPQLAAQLPAMDPNTLGQALRALAWLDGTLFRQTAVTLARPQDQDPSRRMVAMAELARSGQVGLSTLQGLMDEIAESDPQAVTLALQALSRAAEFPLAAATLFAADGMCAELGLPACRSLARRLLPADPGLLGAAQGSADPRVRAVAALLEAEQAVWMGRGAPMAWVAVAVADETPVAMVAESMAQLPPSVPAAGMGQVAARILAAGPPTLVEEAGVHQWVTWRASHARALGEGLGPAILAAPRDEVVAGLGMGLALQGGGGHEAAVERLRAVTGLRTDDTAREGALALVALGTPLEALPGAWAGDAQLLEAASLLEIGEASALAGAVESTRARWTTLPALQLLAVARPDMVAEALRQAPPTPVWLELAARLDVEDPDLAARLLPTSGFTGPVAADWLIRQGQGEGLRLLAEAALAPGADPAPMAAALSVAAWAGWTLPADGLQRVIQSPVHAGRFEPPDLRHHAAMLLARHPDLTPADALALREERRGAPHGNMAAALVARAAAARGCGPEPQPGERP
jgi:hypothetical protein